MILKFILSFYIYIQVNIISINKITYSLYKDLSIKFDINILKYCTLQHPYIDLFILNRIPTNF